MWDTLFPYIAALLPTVAVGVLFFYVIKYILEGDRRERLAQSKWDAAHETNNHETDDHETDDHDTGNDNAPTPVKSDNAKG